MFLELFDQALGNLDWKIKHYFDLSFLYLLITSIIPFEFLNTSSKTSNRSWEIVHSFLILYKISCSSFYVDCLRWLLNNKEGTKWTGIEEVVYSRLQDCTHAELYPHEWTEKEKWVSDRKTSQDPQIQFIILQLQNLGILIVLMFVLR